MKVTTATSLGNVSLAVAIGGLIATGLGLRQGWIAASGWKVLLQTFEAATVGGLADWFAVSALFREVPVPLIRRHTNIIIKNRQRIVEGIADMVQNRWLAPNIIREYLVNFSASQYVLGLPGQRRIVWKTFLGWSEVAAFIERALKDQLRDLKFAEPLGRWLGERLRRGDHHAAWNTLLPILEKAIRSPEVRVIVQRTIARAFDAYKDSGRLKRLVIGLARGLNLVNEEEMVAAVLAKMTEAVREAQSDPRPSTQSENRRLPVRIRR
jgi:uncharacterized membrane-anchored protein YjiN (DUF445 family)